ncbi:MAG: hypothetical protein JXR84_23300 [Anaerolineae bacterium]|nr:hypothetical protein [Anaerolineae bacterium]
MLAITGILILVVALLPTRAETSALSPESPQARTPALFAASTPFTGTQPSPRYGHTLTQIGDLIYLFDGINAVEQGAAKLGPTGEVR